MGIDYIPPLPPGYTGGGGETAQGQGANAYRNLIINGDFLIWQRGTTFTSTAAPPDYTADRWAMTRGAGLQTVTRQAAGLTGFQYCLRTARAAADATTARLYALQACETVNSVPFAGQQVALSFWLRTNAAFPGVLTANLQYGAGVDEGPAAAYTAPQSTFITLNITTPVANWTFYQATGLVATTCTEMKVYFAWDPPAVAAAGSYFEITGVQVELGGSATSFSSLPFDVALAQCQRYYQKSIPYATAPAAAAGGAGGAQYIVNRAGVQFDESQVCFPVTMRIAPTITFYCPAAAGTTWWNYSRGAVSGVSGVNLVGDSGFGALATQVAADAAGQLMAISWSAFAEL